MVRFATAAAAAFAVVRLSASPEMPWRGLMLDESRFFFGKEAVKETVSRMSQCGLNVLHWHLTDDQGWRLALAPFPELTEVGAVRPYSPKLHTEKEPDGKPYGPFFYSGDDVREVVAFAAERKIRVVPEIELPGHCRALLAAHPEFSCKGDLPRETPGWFDVMDDVLCVGNEDAMRYVERVLDETCRLFPDEVVHIGGDECPATRWRGCPKCQARMRNLGLKDVRALHGWAIARFVAHLAKRGRRAMVWDEALESGLCPTSAIVQCWRTGSMHTLPEPPALVAARRGHDVVVSPWNKTYLSLPSGLDDPGEYRRPVHAYSTFITDVSLRMFNPYEGIAPALRGRVMGAECCCWSEGTRSVASLRRKTWPRAATFAAALARVVREADSTDLSRATVYVGTAKPPPAPEGAKTLSVTRCGSMLPLVSWYYPGRWDRVDAIAPGASIDDFMNEEALRSDRALSEGLYSYMRTLFANRDKMREAAAAERFDSRVVFSLPFGRLYNAMIAPMTRHEVGKVVWCGDADPRKLAALARGWRKAWGYDVPFKVLRDGCEEDVPDPGEAPSPYRTKIVEKGRGETRLLYWNCRNGVWSGQAEGYKSFVEWVKAQNPDVCVWVEAATIDKTESAEPMPVARRYLPNGWGELAARYGHEHVCLGMVRDNYPQVVTSRHPIKCVKRMSGRKDHPIMHGAAWFRVSAPGRELNVVTCHLVPHSGVAQSAYRKEEIRQILEEMGEMRGGDWILLGDFNSPSRVDAAHYRFPADDPYYAVHDFIAEKTGLVDILARKHPGEFLSTSGHFATAFGPRIDFVYLSPTLADAVTLADVLDDDYSHIERDYRRSTQAWRPSDHRPVCVDFARAGGL